MKVGTILSLFVLSVVCWLLVGCASNGAGPVASADSAPQKKGHWVTLPPETGSMIPRRVWVDDNGHADTSSMNNLESGSADAVQKIQKGFGTARPGGS